MTDNKIIQTINNSNIDKIEDEIWLNDVWSLYFHDPTDDNWNKDGYIKICTLSTVQEFWTTFEIIREHIHKGMFFLMREHIFPVWNDDENKNGGFLSIKILKKKAATFCENLMINLLNETLLKHEYKEQWFTINGVSISPKRHFCIIKVWLKNTNLQDPGLFNICSGYYGSIIFKTNTCN